MSREPIGVLSHGTIGRTRKVGTDDLGLPIEEAVPTRGGIITYDRDGNRGHTATSCHRATLKTADADRYRATVIRDLLAEGFLREDMCPHVAVAYDDKPPSPTVPAPEGWKGCAGVQPFDKKTQLGGCPCLRGIITKRRAQSKERARVRKSLAADAQKLHLTRQLADAMVTEQRHQPQSAAGQAELDKLRRARRNMPPEQGGEGGAGGAGGVG